MRGEAKRRVIATKNAPTQAQSEAKGEQRVGISARGTKAYTQSRCDASSIKMRRCVTRARGGVCGMEITRHSLPGLCLLPGSWARLGCIPQHRHRKAIATPSQSHEDPVTPGLRTRRQRRFPRRIEHSPSATPQDEAETLSLWSCGDVFGSLFGDRPGDLFLGSVH